MDNLGVFTYVSSFVVSLLLFPDTHKKQITIATHECKIRP